MWKSNTILNNELDGLTPLLSIFKNDDEFIKHFISVTRFFKPEVVKKQAIELKEKIKKGDKIPVRYSMKSKESLYFKNDLTRKGESKRTFKNKKDAKEFAEKETLFHRDTDIGVIIDKDGNYFVRNEIFKATGYRVSQGAISDIRNCMISHIWANTDNPLFFTSLWNITLIPHYISFILDKPDANGNLTKKLKELMQAICFIIYNPNDLLEKNIINIPSEESLKLAQSFVDKKEIIFIEPKSVNSEGIDSNDIIETLFVDDIDSNFKPNKDFAFALLNGLKDSGINFEELFTDRIKTKDICKLSYPILVNVTDDTEKKIRKKMRPVNSDVYYSKPLFEINNSKYLVCNDWKIFHKELIVEWLQGKIN